MKIFISILRVDLRRAILSQNFMISMLFIILVMLISCSGFISDQSDVLYLLVNALTGSGSFMFILCIAPIFPYGISFVSDMEDKAFSFWIIRTGVKKYGISKFITSVIAGFLTVGAGIYFFSLIMSIFFPLFTDIPSGDTYTMLLKDNKPWIYILATAIHYSLSGALFAGLAMAVSAFIPNKFSVIITPIVIYFLTLRVTAQFSLPAFLKPNILVQGVYYCDSIIAAFLYKLIPVLIILVFLLYVTVRQIEKRIEKS